MRISFERPPLDIINEPKQWWGGNFTRFTDFTDEFTDWLIMSNIEVHVFGEGQLLEAYWNAANDEDPPKVIHFDFTREQDALAFKMRWL